MADPGTPAPLESVHSPTVSAHISHAVIASYAAAAAREVAGVRAIADGHGLRDRRPDPDRAPRGVRVSSDGDRIALHLHVILDYGTDVAAAAEAADAGVRGFLRSMIDLELDELEITVDDVVDEAPR
ncbi:MAG TPA: Asp23/Gls24 family envelope stress response protein [Gaiellales bacterium]|nr:Asp23/Gls24 family envelope stress response protein [Gaiellales bacterium]